MTSPHPYGEPKTVADAFAELRRCAGSQFDGQIVEAFSAVLTAGVAAGQLLPA